MKRNYILAALLFAAMSATAQVEVPYSTSFDNTYGEYDGTSFLPVGWTVSGDNPFVTANNDHLKAKTGSYYLVSPNNLYGPRNERLYTPLFHMEKGKRYNVSYELYMPGYDYAYTDAQGHYAEAYHHPLHHLTYGTEQDFDFHNPAKALIAIKGDVLPAEWVPQHATFVPEETGDYCFCLTFDSDDSHYGNIAIDDFMVSCEGVALPPAVDITYGGLFDLYYSTVVDFDGGGVQFTSLTEHVTNYEWKVTDADNGNVLFTSTDAAPRFYFPETGNYSVSLRGYNADFEASKTLDLAVEHIGSEGSSLCVLYNYGEKVNTMFNPNYTPVIGSQSPTDFATGPNHTYRRFAERVEIPENVTLTLNTLQYFLSQCSFASLQSGSVRTIPFTFSIYGETDGLPDESKLIWRKEVTMDDAFTTNTSGLGGATQLSRSLEGAKVSGTFYVAFEFSDEFPIDPWSEGGDRSVIEFTSHMHHDHRTTFFYKDAATGAWHPLDNFHPDLAGFGMNMVLWTSASVTEPVAVERITTSLPENISTSIFDLQGRSVSATSRGVYIVNGKKVIR